MNEKEFEGELKRVLKRDKSYAVKDWKYQLILRHNGVDERKRVFPEINKAIKNDIKGVYVYMRNGFCLYVGAGRLRERLHMHYLESIHNSKSRRGSKRHYKFFGKNLGEMRIFCKEMNEDDKKAKVIEQMLTYVLKPKFYEEDK